MIKTGFVVIILTLSAQIAHASVLDKLVRLFFRSSASTEEMLPTVRVLKKKFATGYYSTRVRVNQAAKTNPNQNISDYESLANIIVGEKNVTVTVVTRKFSNSPGIYSVIHVVTDTKSEELIEVIMSTLGKGLNPSQKKFERITRIEIAINERSAPFIPRNLELFYKGMENHLIRTLPNAGRPR